MGKNSRCVIDIGDNEPELHENIQGCIKIAVMWMEITSCKNYPKMEL